MSRSAVLSLWFTRFNIRELVLLIVIVFLGFGWFSSEQRADRERRLREKHLQHADEELGRARHELQSHLKGRQPDRNRSFWAAELEGSNLTGMTISSRSNAFQHASFRNCRLENSTLEGGGSSFQNAVFDGAQLTGAKLTGEHASFQGASFAGAELTNATLSGGSASFQLASFEDAVLVRAKLSGNFQGANLSGTQFQAADLSAIDPDNLASCYFKVPPSYDGRTLFPVGFDPFDCLWKRVEAP